MTITIKNMLGVVATCGAVAVLSGCSYMCPAKHAMHHNKNADTPVFHQTYGDGDVHSVTAKVYTRSMRGGESKMGHIKFNETQDGLKMTTDLIDLRPNVAYTTRIYQCGNCGNGGTCCSDTPMNINLPTIKITERGRLNQTHIIRGLTATQLNGAKIFLERDGGYKAAWGTLMQ